MPKLYTFSRECVFDFVPQNAVCIELGVAQGHFADSVLSKYNLTLYGIDKWDDVHNYSEYLSTKTKLSKYGERSKLIRTTFAKALHLFEDEYFDLIYIDGYAHTGQNNGETIRSWYPKLKPGGIFSGDDYSDRWPLTKLEVDKFMQDNNLSFDLCNINTKSTLWCSKEPTWFTKKPVNVPQLVL